MHPFSTFRPFSPTVCGSRPCFCLERLRQFLANILAYQYSLAQNVSLNAAGIVSHSTLTALFNFQLQETVLCRRPLPRRSSRLRKHLNHVDKPVFGIIHTIEVTEMLLASTNPQVSIA